MKTFKSKPKQITGKTKYKFIHNSLNSFEPYEKYS